MTTQTGQIAERDRVLSQIEKKGNEAYDSLSDCERVWFTITRLIFCIRDGGLPSYFYNGYSCHVTDCMRSLELLGATEMHEMVRRMNRIDWERQPRLFDVLKEMLKSWTGVDARETERELQEATRLEAKLDEYVTTHRLA
jgi:hypothetical protein